MYLSIPIGTTSKIIQLPIFDSSSTTGAMLTGLVWNSAGLTGYYNREGAAGAATAITLATATKGTWATGGFIAVDGTNMPGWYELHIPDAALASGAKSVSIHLKGATNMVPVPIIIELTATSNQDAVRGGMTALPNANAEAAGGLYTRGTGAGQIAQDANGNVRVNLDTIKTQAVTAAAGVTFPTSIASPTNITAATGIVLSGVTHTGAVIPTVTTVTNQLTAAAIATDVWAAATRTLTAGTNIVLAKGVGVTGFNDLSSGDVATAVWNAATVTYGSAGSYGLLVETNLDATISSRSSHVAADVWSVATRALTDKVDFSILAANRATLIDEIWDEDVDASHQTAGTAGKKLDDAGGAADPWSTALPGAYGVGTAGNILGNRLVGTIATGTHNPQSGDAYAIVNHVTYGNSAIETLVDDLETRCTEVRLAELDAANLPTDVAGVQSDTNDIQTRLPAVLTADGNMKSDALRINGVAAAAAQLAKSAAVIISGAAIAGTLSTTQMTTDLTEATDDHYNGRIIIWTSGVLLGQATNITDYTGATKLLTYTAITEAPTAADTFILV